MILVDTSIWVDHLRNGDAGLIALLEEGNVLAHPWVTGELALGELASRHEVVNLIGNLPQAVVATPAEVLRMIEERHLYGRGIGYVDVQLLGATLLTPHARLWTRDKRLAEVAAELDIAPASTASRG